MPDEFIYDVFLSHSSKDKSVVRDIAERLRKDGIKVWFDELEIKPGDSIPAKIEEGLDRSRVLVLCMSANAFGSDWAQLESGTFRFRDPLNKERRFLPVRMDDAPIKGSLAQFLYIDWRHGWRANEYPKLLKAIKRSESKQESANAEHQNEIRRELASVVKARRAEWDRMRSAFEREADKFPDLSLALFFLAHDKPPTDEAFPEPRYVINLWQYYGMLDGDDSKQRLISSKVTRFGLSGAELTACALLHGGAVDHFRSMAKRAGTLLPDSISHLIIADLPEKLGDLAGPGKPIMVANNDPLAKWLNMLLVATSALHPYRLKDGELIIDPFAASLSVFDYFGDVMTDAAVHKHPDENISDSALTSQNPGRAWSGVRGVIQGAYSTKTIKGMLGRAGLDMAPLGDTSTFKGELLNRVDFLIQSLDEDARDRLVLGCVQEIMSHEHDLHGDAETEESTVINDLRKVMSRFGVSLEELRCK